MDYPRYIFECECNRSDYVRLYQFNYRKTCPEHHGKLLVEKIYQCPECGEIYKSRPQGNGVCPICKVFKNKSPGSGIYRNGSIQHHDFPIWIEWTRRDRSPCLECPRRDENKDGGLCMICPYRAAYAVSVERGIIA